MRQISIIGAGQVGATLGRLFAQQGYPVKEIYSRTRASAETVAAIIGCGKTVGTLKELSPTDILLITTSDNALHNMGDRLVECDVIQQGTIAFHCSGATPSSILAPLRQKGGHIASVHPVKTFTSPLHDADTFAGTWCGVEGDVEAIAVLGPMFEAIGGRLFQVDSTKKVLYHTAIVFICNYLFPLLEVGLQCYEGAGVPRSVAAQVVEPILHATIDNALRLGPGKAITGPIARGDERIVRNQVRELADFRTEFKTLYELLGGIATRLALEKGVAAPEKIAEIQKILSYDQYQR